MVLLAFLRQNNKAASMIDCERYSDAIEELSKVLMYMKKDLGWTGSQCFEIPRTPILDQCMFVDDEKSSKLLGEIAKLHEQENDQTFLYNQAIRVPPALEASCQQNIVDFAGIIIFNLALAHHLVASASSPTERGTRDLNFQKALTLYSLAIRIQTQQTNRLGPNTVFAMTILNNTGCIYHALNDIILSTDCALALSSILMCLDVNNNNVQEAGMLTRQPHLDGFRYTVHSVLFPPRDFTAPSA